MTTSTALFFAFLAALQGILLGAVPNNCDGQLHGHADAASCQSTSAEKAGRVPQDESSLLQVFESVKRGNERSSEIELKMPAVGPAGLLLDMMESDTGSTAASKPSRARRLHTSLLEFASLRQSATHLDQDSSGGGVAGGIITCIVIVFALIAVYWVLTSNKEEASPEINGQRQGLMPGADASLADQWRAQRGVNASGGPATSGPATSGSPMMAQRGGGMNGTTAATWSASHGGNGGTTAAAWSASHGGMDGNTVSSRGGMDGSTITSSSSWLNQPAGRSSPTQSASAAKFQTVAASHMSPSFGDKRMPTAAISLSPSLEWATVPEKSEICLVSPMLSQVASNVDETSVRYTVSTKDGCNMVSLGFLRHKMDPREPEMNGASEYVTLGLPEEDESKDLVMCAIGASGGRGALEAQVYLFGKLLYGVIREDPGGASYTLTLANQQPALTATLQGYGTNRRVTIVNSKNKDQIVAKAEPGGSTLSSWTGGGASYDIYCYPLSDILLNISIVACVDRLVILGAAKR